MNVTNGTNGTRTGPRPQLPAPPVDLANIACLCIVALMIVFENSLVVGAFFVNMRLRTKTNLLLVSLAIADLLKGTITVPLWVYISITYTYKGPLYNFYLHIDVFSGVSSLLNLTAISLERCYALIYPIKHRNTGKRVFLATIIVVWVLAALAWSMTFLPWEQRKYLGIIITVPFFFVPLIVILVAYGTMFHIARAHARRRGVSSFKKDLRIATTVAVVIGLFVVCWTPFFALNFTFSVCVFTEFKSVGCSGLWKMSIVILKITKWLQWGHAMCNPIIYGLRNKEFRQTFRKILLGLYCKKIRLSNYRKGGNGHPHKQRDSPHQVVPQGLNVRRESYQHGGSREPNKFEFAEFGLLTLNVGAFHNLPSVNDVSASPLELSNLTFEGNQTETGICSFDQADSETRL